jgi:hypothetical protein
VIIAPSWTEAAIRGRRYWRFLLPIVAVFVIFKCVDVLRAGAKLTSPSVTFYGNGSSSGSIVIGPTDLLLPGSTGVVVAEDLLGRLQLAAAAAVFFAAFGALVVLCALAIHRCHPPMRRRGRVLLVVMAMLFAVLGWLISVHDTRTVSVLLPSFEALANAVMANTGRAGDLVHFGWTTRWIGSLAIFGAALLAVTAAVIVDGASTAQSELADLRKRCSALRTTLAAGAALLASAIMVVRALQTWTLYFVPAVHAEVLQPVADSWSMALGTYWTLVLVAAYVPAAGMVHHAALAMADNRIRRPDDNKTREQWMEEHGLNVSIQGQVTRALLLLAPWISGGSLGEIAGLFAK